MNEELTPLARPCSSRRPNVVHAHRPIGGSNHRTSTYLQNQPYGQMKRSKKTPETFSCSLFPQEAHVHRLKDPFQNMKGRLLIDIDDASQSDQACSTQSSMSHLGHSYRGVSTDWQAHRAKVKSQRIKGHVTYTPKSLTKGHSGISSTCGITAKRFIK